MQPRRTGKRETRQELWHNWHKKYYKTTKFQTICIEIWEQSVSSCWSNDLSVWYAKIQHFYVNLLIGFILRKTLFHVTISKWIRILKIARASEHKVQFFETLQNSLWKLKPKMLTIVIILVISINPVVST